MSGLLVSPFGSTPQGYTVAYFVSVAGENSGMYTCWLCLYVVLCGSEMCQGPSGNPLWTSHPPGGRAGCVCFGTVFMQRRMSIRRMFPECNLVDSPYTPRALSTVMGTACVPWAWGHPDAAPTYQAILGWLQAPPPFLTVTQSGERSKAPDAVIQRQAPTWPDEHTLSSRRKLVAAPGAHSDTGHQLGSCESLHTPRLAGKASRMLCMTDALGQVTSQIECWEACRASRILRALW